MLETYRRGDRLKHKTKTDWGLGEVFEDQSGDHVRVIFEYTDDGLKNFKVGVAPFIRVNGEEAKSMHLDVLVKQASKKGGKSKTPPLTTFPKSVAYFLHHFPNGFLDPKFIKDEREYKLDAHRLTLELLSREKLEAQVNSGSYTEIWNHAQTLINKTNLISHFEKIRLANGVDSPGREQMFATALYKFLYGEEPADQRFEAFTKMLYDIQAATWPVATYFSFLAFPESQIFLKPEVTKHTAKILRMDIQYTPEVNWSTYSKVLKLAETLKLKLSLDGRAILVPKDMIDLQSFIWVIGAYDA